MDKTYEGDLAAIAQIEIVPLILDVACRTTGMGFAAVARVTEDRWICCAVRDDIAFGLQPGGELKVETTICDEIRGSGEPVIIDNVAEDPTFCGHPTPAMYGFQSYISVPIRRPDGRFFGTLCAIDPRPARLKTPEIMGSFRLFADLIGFHLDAQDRLTASEDALLAERQNSDLREQFIAVLGHDLRNPLTAINSGAQLLSRMPIGEKGLGIARLIHNSTVRMAGLIDNVLDFARARLGGGIAVRQAADPALEDALKQVVEEARTSSPDRTIESDIAVREAVACDSGRIAQLLSNLVANALTHGDPQGPVRVVARTDAAGFSISVSNRGKRLSEEVIGRLFQPFARGAAPGEQGLGLGLYIASEIARAHGGTLDVVSTPEETRFTFRMPAVARAEWTAGARP